MSTRLKEKEERILKILEKLAEESAKGKPIVVEGRKDSKNTRNWASKFSLPTLAYGIRNGTRVTKKINKGNSAMNRLKAMELAREDKAPCTIPKMYISIKS